jgi:Family of unknown function (DUF5906)
MKTNPYSQKKSLQIADNQEVNGINKVVEKPTNYSAIKIEDEQQKMLLEEKRFAELMQKDKEGESEESKTERRNSLKKISKQYIRVGDKYYKFVKKSNKKGQYYDDKIELSKTTITDQFSRNILPHIEKYDGFTLVPSHVNYEQVRGTFYNQYYQISHKPKEGGFDNIMKLINHIFGESHTNFALDYLQILYKNPTQNLPILVLESFEKNTGKSTFSNLLFNIFQQNAIKLGNGDLSSDFNGFWLQRLLIIVDETSLDKDAVTQMLKRLSTETGKVVSNSKGSKQEEVEFIGKFVFCSNQEGKALKIEKDDTRWAVFKVPTFAEKGIKDDPMMEGKIVNEIPAFLNYLQSRELHYNTCESRMWFDKEVYFTPQLRLYFENSLSPIAQAVKELVKDTFMMFPEEKELKFSATDLMDELTGNVKYLDKTKLKSIMEYELKIKLNKKSSYSYYSLKTAERNSEIGAYKNARKNTFYHFYRE